MKRIYARMFFVGLFSMLFFGSCTDDSNSSTHPSFDVVIITDDGNSPANPSSDVIIIVDKDHANAVPVPCGTEDAVCESITDGLLSAAMYQNGIPAVLVRPGIYDKEPAYPIQIHVPVILQAEQTHGAIIDSSRDGALAITASDVMIEGLKIVSHGCEIIKVFKRGHAILKDIHVEIDKQPFVCCNSVLVGEEATTVIEHSELQRSIFSNGSLTVNDSVISPAYDCSARLSIFNGRGILNNNTLYGEVYVDQRRETEIELEFKGNTIYRLLKIEDGAKVNLEGNTFVKGIWVKNVTTINLSNNLIHNMDYHDDRHALFLQSPSIAFISRNRFDSKAGDTTIIACEEGTTINTDGTNTLLNPNCRIVCDGLPTAPGTELF